MAEVYSLPGLDLEVEGNCIRVNHASNTGKITTCSFVYDAPGYSVDAFGQEPQLFSIPGLDMSVYALGAVHVSWSDCTGRKWDFAIKPRALGHEGLEASDAYPLIEQTSRAYEASFPHRSSLESCYGHQHDVAQMLLGTTGISQELEHASEISHAPLSFGLSKNAPGNFRGGNEDANTTTMTLPDLEPRSLLEPDTSLGTSGEMFNRPCIYVKYYGFKGLLSVEELSKALLFTPDIGPKIRFHLDSSRKNTVHFDGNLRLRLEQHFCGLSRDRVHDFDLHDSVEQEAVVPHSSRHAHNMKWFTIVHQIIAKEIQNVASLKRTCACRKPVTAS